MDDDLDTIRERHVRMVAGPFCVAEYPTATRQAWPCDAIREADRADKAEAALAEAEFARKLVGRSLDAAQDRANLWRADADRLAEVGEAVLAQAEHSTTSKLWDYELGRLRAALDAHDRGDPDWLQRNTDTWNEQA